MRTPRSLATLAVHLITARLPAKVKQVVQAGYCASVLAYAIAAALTTSISAQEFDAPSSSFPAWAAAQNSVPNDSSQPSSSMPSDSAAASSLNAIASSSSLTRLGPGQTAILGSGVRPEQANSNLPPPYKILRYNEDYSYLRDPSNLFSAGRILDSAGFGAIRQRWRAQRLLPVRASRQVSSKRWLDAVKQLWKVSET